MNHPEFSDENKGDFVKEVLQNDVTCINYLRLHGLFVTAPKCRGRNGSYCNKTMLEKQRKGIPIWKCPDWKCKSTRSFSSTNDFFVTFDDYGRSHRNLRLTDICQLVWLWCYGRMTTREAAKAAGVSLNTVSVRWARCREVCTRAESRLPKLVGTEDAPVQVDESYFAGRRKYNRGRLCSGDRRSSGESRASRELEIEVSSWGGAPQEGEGADSELGGRRRNYGDRVVGPWVVGLYKSAREVRFFIVTDRKASTLRDIIYSTCEQGSIIVTDEWKGYAKIGSDGFVHKTVNHSKWFVNPGDGANTQGIERVWVEGKAILKRHRRPTAVLQSYLDEIAWRRRQSDSHSSLMVCFWRDVQQMYDLTNLQ